MDVILRPLRKASSKQAQQTYLNTILLLATSLALLMFSIAAYILFYMSIPQIGIERVVHLQFGFYSDGINPYGFVSLGSELVSQQSYDIVLELDLPRSPPNLESGNFMLDMVLLSPSYRRIMATSDAPIDIKSSIPSEAILFSSRRPAILTYHPRLVRLGKQIAGLTWYLLGWQRDSEKLEIPMAERVYFNKGWKNVPKTVYLEVQSRGQDLQVYNMQLKLRARYEGIRWLMYNHRIFSFIVFTTAFWAAEILFTILAWVIWNIRSSPGKEEEKREPKADETDASTAIKTEKDEGELETDDLDLSDTPRSFPTYGRQAPLRYVPKFKTEDDTERMISDEAERLPQAAEADDESEEPVNLRSFTGGRSDSGLGTSFSEGGPSIRYGLQRRSRGKSTK